MQRSPVRVRNVQFALGCEEVREAERLRHGDTAQLYYARVEQTTHHTTRRPLEPLCDWPVSIQLSHGFVDDPLSPCRDSMMTAANGCGFSSKVL
jgi:hypothetical protein